MFLALARRQAQRSMNFGEMIDRLGIDPFATPALANAIGAGARTCSWCSHSSTCRAWLDSRAGALSEAPDFCPNRERLAAAKAASVAMGRKKLFAWQALRRQEKQSWTMLNL